MPKFRYKVEAEQEADGRWIARIADLPGVMAYGQTKEEAVAEVEALGARVESNSNEAGDGWPKAVLDAAGAFPDFPSLEEIRKGQSTGNDDVESAQ
jgi:predicted RNase H-like HicB family nuclease